MADHHTYHIGPYFWSPEYNITEIRHKSYIILLAVVYRQRNTASPTHFFEIVSPFLETYKNVIITSDFNADLKPRSPDTRTLSELVKSLARPRVIKSRRLQRSKPEQLQLYLAGNLTINPTDINLPLILELSIAANITSIFDTLAPMATSIIPSKYKPWVSSQLRSLMRKRDKAYKKSEGSINLEVVDIFKKLRSRVSNALDTAQNQYLSSHLSTAKSLKARWNTLKKVGTTKSALPRPFNYFTPNDLNLYFASTVNRHGGSTVTHHPRRVV